MYSALPVLPLPRMITLIYDPAGRVEARTGNAPPPNQTLAYESHVIQVKLAKRAQRGDCNVLGSEYIARDPADVVHRHTIDVRQDFVERGLPPKEYFLARKIA